MGGGALSQIKTMESYQKSAFSALPQEALWHMPQYLSSSEAEVGKKKQGQPGSLGRLFCKKQIALYSSLVELLPGVGNATVWR